MKEQKYINVNQKAVVFFSVIIILILGYLWIQNVFLNDWKNYQREYVHYSERITESLDLPAPVIAEKGIYELDLPHLHRVDRCVSCHRGTDNPLMRDVPQPLTTHPGDYLEDHPASDFGCTICHGGQGRAMNETDAHGLAPEAHWSNPIMSQPYIESSCGKCHLAIFGGMGQEEGAGTFRKGQEIFATEGCLGCHKARGVGGILGPDLTEQGEKTKHEYNFQNVSGEQTVSNWLKEHFRDPEMISPGSRMLKIDLPEKDLDALATFVMGLAKPDIPVTYFSIEMLQELKGMRERLPGDLVYSYTCSSCHGKSGKGKDYTMYETGVPAIMNHDFLRIASKEFIYFTIMKGRSRKLMASWNPDVSGFYDDELHSLTTTVKPDIPPFWMKEVQGMRNGNTRNGQLIYEQNCVTCHGDHGQGAIGTGLNQRDFLRLASDQFLIETIAKGRNNTAMPAWPEFSKEEAGDLLSYIRSWYDGPVYPGYIRLPEGDRENGELMYHYNCSRCHGINGAGNTGPAIINRKFLAAASDYYIYHTVAEGREHTAMFGWSTDVFNQERLDKKMISDIIAYLRFQAALPPVYIYEGANPGNKNSGKGLFLKHCAECHGEDGKGISAPGLNNQEFLNAASNGYIMGTMTLGRKGTRMPSWGYPGEDHPVLTPEERKDITAWIRSWQRIKIGF